MRRIATSAASFAFVCLVGTTARAGGWQEVHQTSDDLRIAVAPDGIATFEHTLRYRIVAGKLKTLDVSSIDPRGELAPETTVVAEKGGEIAARVEPNPKSPGTARIVIDDPKGLGRGVYVASVKYKLDLVATKILARDGAMWRLAWTAPAATEGRDGARVVFELPPAPTEPRLPAADAAQTTLATFHRLADKDELELVRPHVPRGEAVTWAARVDPKALPAVNAPELRPPPAPPPPSTIPGRAPAILAAAVLSAIAGALAFALRRKRALVEAACAARSVVPRPLVAVPPRFAPLVPFAYGAAGAGAFASFAWASPSAGAVLVVLALLLGTFRAPTPITKPRGPGAWRDVPDEDVLVPKRPEPMPGDTLDLATTRGKLLLAGIAAVVAMLAWVLATRIAGVAVALPLTAVALVPVFATGSRAQLPARPAELASRMLRPARDALARKIDLSHVDLRVVARFLSGSIDAFDEVRIVCAPIDRTPGLRALELALAVAAPGPHGAVPEVLVRYDDGSPAAVRIAAFAPNARVVPGRSAEEKVARIVPADPTADAAAKLLAALLAELEGRRVTDRAQPPASTRSKRYAGPERRVRRWPALAAVTV